ncbi:hypothetical protein H0H81_005101 [Sphagnurus paluster]|uniref:Protein YOP1 n=1 Tax=Sphagnurus paluster TaxID=117069 RepID=A0A9P7GT06_9AGAR|nr:hypothetical protein H0H81_005101 [Sphagnurus paluster]
MLFYLTARLISSVTAFIYPGYASYKTLSQRPASEEDLERWLMYWSVLGCIIGVEYVAEWIISWIPLYYTLKTLFLLYLALPQTQGSSYIYTTHLQPFFHAHETQIDAALASLKTRAVAFIQERARALWDAAAAAANLPSSQGQQPHFTPVGGQGNAGSAAPPSLGDPASGPAQLMGSLWRSYGPGIMASGAALLSSATAAASKNTNSRSRPALTTPQGSRFSQNMSGSTQSVLERRRQLEAELAALSAVPASMAVPEAPFPSSKPSGSRTSSASDLGLRERTHSNAGSASGARFEEVEVPSDVEGYDVGDEDGTGHARPGMSTRASWFGWAGAASSGSKGSYERVKSE